MKTELPLPFFWPSGQTLIPVFLMVLKPKVRENPWAGAQAEKAARTVRAARVLTGR